MKRLIKSPWGVFLGLMLLQWAWASFLSWHVVKSKSLSGGNVRIEARRAVSWGHFVPALGVLLLLDPYSHDIAIEGYGQRTVINVDMVGDFPWDELKLHEHSGTRSVVDNLGNSYALFKSRKAGYLRMQTAACRFVRSIRP